MKKHIITYAGIFLIFSMLTGMSGCKKAVDPGDNTGSSGGPSTGSNSASSEPAGPVSDDSQNMSYHTHDYDSSFVCTVCGKVKKLTVKQFVAALGSEVTTITADPSRLGITKSDDGLTVNIYGVSIYGGFYDYGSANREKVLPESLVTADLTGLNTANVTSMKGMFSGCTNLTSLNISNFDTSCVTDMYKMFYYCSSLTSLDLSSFDTSHVTDMYNMFYYCSSLTSLDLSSFDTTHVTNMYCMFESCSGLTSLDVSSFDTSHVTNMYCMFESCSGLTSLDVSSFDTSRVTDMDYMFHSCSNLQTIYASLGFVTTNLMNSYNIFSGCTSLVGGSGTAYDSSHTDAEYARIDGKDGLPGYFTAK